MAFSPYLVRCLSIVCCGVAVLRCRDDFTEVKTWNAINNHGGFGRFSRVITVKSLSHSPLGRRHSPGSELWCTEKQ